MLAANPEYRTSGCRMSIAYHRCRSGNNVCAIREIGLKGNLDKRWVVLVKLHFALINTLPASVNYGDFSSIPHNWLIKPDLHHFWRGFEFAAIRRIGSGYLAVCQRMTRHD